MNEQDVSLTDALGILPWEGAGGQRREERKETLGGAERQGDLLTEHRPRTAPHDPCPGQQCSRDGRCQL